MKKVFFTLTVFLFVCGSVHAAVVWSDEFNGPNIDTDTWTWDVGGWGFGNGQLEYNTARRENSYIDNGSLVLEARRENYFDNSFTSARMLTQGRFAFKYGTLEARIKLPDTADGLWPAFWLLGNNFPGIAWPDCGEIDILESGAADGIANGTQNELINCAIHFSDTDGNYGSDASWVNASDLIPGLTDLSADYHRYKVEWTPTYLKFFLDDVQFGVWDITPPYLAEFHQPAFPIINIAIGGWNYVQINEPAGITALPTAGSSEELRMDWIRLEDNAFTEIYLGADAEETGTFGVFTETTPVDSSLVYGDDTAPGWPYSDEAAVYIWSDEYTGEPTMVFAATQATPSEGTECWTLDFGSIPWFGMAVFLPNYRNMTNYSDGYLHFDIQSTSTDTMKVGVQSSRGGQFWLPMGDETTEFGFARDGNWHSITVPLNRFANTDFKTIHQIFMLLADTVSAPGTVSIDNVYWEPSVARPTPENGNFGVYTETAANKDADEFGLGIDGDFFVWENTLNPATQTPYEGAESMSFTSAGLGWFGAAFTPNVKYNLTAFRYPESKLRFAMKTSSTTTFQVGMKSGNIDGVGQKWITFASGSDPYGFVRDGNWHVVEIPMSDFTTEVDLSEVSQLFQILGTAEISNIEFDDVYFTGGGTAETGTGNIHPTVSITSPADGTLYDSGDDITIIADANDPNGTITKVEFFEGLNLLGQDTTEPYSYTWLSVPAGQYALTAVATDSNDVTKTSAVITVSVGTPELTTIDVSPSTTTIPEGTYTQFTASGLDQFGQPFAAAVDWSVSDGGVIDENGYYVAIDAGGPDTVTATEAGGVLSGIATVNVSAGSLACDYDFNGRVDLVDFSQVAGFWMATDCDGSNGFCGGADHVGDGDVDYYDLEVLMVSWLKTVPPSVSIASPAGGSSFSPGDDVTIDASIVINAAGTTITTVEFYEGANYLGEDTTAPYSYTWAAVPEGVYVLTAVVTDDTGQSSTSGAVNISVLGTGLVNGGFENDLVGWDANPLGAGSTIEVLAETPRSGSYAAKLVTDWQGGNGVKSELIQTVGGISAGVSYDFEFWVKGLMGEGGVAWAEIHWLNDSDTYMGGTGLLALWHGLSETSYQSRGGTFVSPAGTTKAKISIRLEGGALAAVNTMYVDDVSFE
ncbi:MAG: Ig-like domain-containing protein [Planctomycetota bacterium]|jgi:beta-glucanase (GH16 family)